MQGQHRWLQQAQQVIQDGLHYRLDHPLWSRLEAMQLSGSLNSTPVLIVPYDVPF